MVLCEPSSGAPKSATDCSRARSFYGERRLFIATFSVGHLHNFLQAMAAEVFVQAGADFGLSLLRESISNGSATAVLSPISIAFALSLAYAGAGGDTRKQFNAVFAKNGMQFARKWSKSDDKFCRSIKQRYRRFFCALIQAIQQREQKRDARCRESRVRRRVA